ncbi:MAG: ribonuclease HI [Bacteroidota bacterium]|nr:ribonuclease HI [Bacteroidota bacterium]MDE2834809.1 ribonuclease HI [Bacteroidota bacterium]MDE2955507.1 ribonuclease HI [Bacteroidota bacterium]
MKDVIIYTDGSCLNNPGPGGWAAILKYGKHERVLSGHSSATTNNRMEMQAALEALIALKEPCRVRLHTDSQYLRMGFAAGWILGWRSRNWRTSSGQPVKNQDLWQALWEQAQVHKIQWIKVKAHANNRLNNRVDGLAVKARNRGMRSGR